MFLFFVRTSLALLMAFPLWHAVAADDEALDEPKIVDEDDPPSIKVIKIRNNTATVVFSRKHSPLTVGQKGRLVKKLKTTDVEENITETVSRSRFIGLDASLAMLDTKTDPATTTASRTSIDTKLVYGWNKERFEYGIILNYAFTKFATTDTKSLLAGGVVDFNFSRNTAEKNFVTGARLILAMGQEDSSAQTKAAAATLIEPALVVKWFGLSTNLAGTAAVGYRLYSVTLDKAKSSDSGLVAKVGIQSYF